MVGIICVTWSWSWCCGVIIYSVLLRRSASILFKISCTWCRSGRVSWRFAGSLLTSGLVISIFFINVEFFFFFSFNGKFFIDC